MRRHRAWFMCLLVVLAAFLAASCDNLLSPSQNVNVDVITNPSPAPTPPPATPPPAASGLTPPASVRVGFFGGSCPNGRAFPPNGAGTVPVGCTGFATATPKRADGTDQTPAEHGPAIVWSLTEGSAVVTVVSTNEAFNKDVNGLSPGSFTLCATVQGVTGCLAGAVIP